MKRLGSEDILALCEARGVIIRNGHFVYAGGRHGSVYANMKALLHDYVVAMMLARETVLRWLDILDAPYPEIVAGPASGGASFANFVAAAFNELSRISSPVIAARIDKDGAGGFRLTEAAAAAVSNKTVLVTEDVVTTSQSLVRASAAIHPLCTIVGTFAALNRSDIVSITLTDERRIPRRDVAIPLFSLAQLPLVSYAPNACTLCAAGVPISTDVGHGKTFLASRSDPARSS